MGWSFTVRPESTKDYLRDQLTWESEKSINRCMDIAMKINAAYAAVETTDKASGEKTVFAVIVLMKYVRGEDYNWGTKDLSENCGPVVHDCPKRILDLLTATDNECAKEWRARCYENLNRRMPKIGTKVRFEKPIRFTNGVEETEFEVVKVGRRKKALRGKNGGYFRVSRRLWQDREWRVTGQAQQGTT